MCQLDYPGHSCQDCRVTYPISTFAILQGVRDIESRRDDVPSHCGDLVIRHDLGEGIGILCYARAHAPEDIIIVGILRSLARGRRQGGIGMAGRGRRDWDALSLWEIARTPPTFAALASSSWLGSEGRSDRDSRDRLPEIGRKGRGGSMVNCWAGSQHLLSERLGLGAVAGLCFVLLHDHRGLLSRRGGLAGYKWRMAGDAL